MLNEKLFLDQHLFSEHTFTKSTRDGFGEALIELGQKNPSVVVLTADLSTSTKVIDFAQKFPKRFVQMGIAEQNMMGIAAGLALSGKIPFLTSIAIFSPGRNWEQIRLSGAFQNTNVKIVSVYGGLSHCLDGGMAQILEDFALMRTLPHMTVVCPCDYEQTKKATLDLVKFKGPVYMRLGREATAQMTTPYTPFEIGKAQIIKDGIDVTIISTGTMLYESLMAAKDLKAKHKIDAEVINCHTLKPLDEKTILASAKKTNLVVTVEDHQIAGGLGGTIAELLSEKHPTKLIRIGVEDRFGESGKYTELKDKYGLSAHHIVSKILNQLKRTN